MGGWVGGWVDTIMTCLMGMNESINPPTHLPNRYSAPPSRSYQAPPPTRGYVERVPLAVPILPYSPFGGFGYGVSPFGMGGGYMSYRSGFSPLDVIILGGFAYAGKWVGGWLGGWMVGWVGGWMDGWMDGWRKNRRFQCAAVAHMDGWVDRLSLTHPPTHPLSTAFNILKNNISGSQWDGIDDAAPSSLGNGVSVLKIQVGLQVNDRSAKDSILGQLDDIAKTADVTSRQVGGWVGGWRKKRRFECATVCYGSMR